MKNWINIWLLTLPSVQFTESHIFGCSYTMQQFFSAHMYIYRNKAYALSFMTYKVLTQQTFVLMKTSWRRLDDVFRLRLRKTSLRRLQDVLIKANIFASALRLQKTPSRRLQDVLVKTNIFVLAIRLQDVFKTFSRRIIKLKCSW